MNTNPFRTPVSPTLTGWFDATRRKNPQDVAVLSGILSVLHSYKAQGYCFLAEDQDTRQLYPIQKPTPTDPIVARLDTNAAGNAAYERLCEGWNLKPV